MSLTQAEAVVVGTFERENQRWITVRAPRSLDDTCRKIPGARWSRNYNCWGYPYTSASAARILDLFKKAEVDPQVRMLAEAPTIAARAKSQGADLSPIPSLKTRPWRHQLAAYHFAKGLPATMLAMGMGSGKSLVVVALAANQQWKRTLILCPRSVVNVWPKEFAKHAQSPVSVLALSQGATVKEKTEYADGFLKRTQVGGKPAVVVINYEAAWRDPFAKWCLNQPWDAVVLDESHRTKDPGGVTSRFVTQLGKRALRRLCLTGTPMPHSLLDIYAQYRFLDPGIFGTSFAGFKQRYAISGGYQGYQVVGYQQMDDFQARMSQIAFMVRSEDVLDLPEFHHVERRAPLAPAAAKTYRQLEQDMVTWIQAGGKEVTVTNALTKLLRLQQITSGHLTDDDRKVHVVDTTKRELLKDALEDLDPREPVVVFCRFLHDLNVVEQVGKELGRRYAELSGRRRDALTGTSTLSPDCDLAGIQIQSGGVGIDLTRARYCVYYSLGFSLGDFEQSLKRLHRPGQTRPVTYIHLLLEETVDAKVYEALRGRKEVVESILAELRYKGGRG